jgi:hypothetical protein
MLGEPITWSIMLGKLMGMYGALPTHSMADVRMGSPGTLRNIMGMGHTTFHTTSWRRE